MTDVPWRAMVALILAAGVTAAIVLLCVQSLVAQGRIPAEEATLLATVVGAAVGAVATYLGSRLPHD